MEEAPSFSVFFLEFAADMLDPLRTDEVATNSERSTVPGWSQKFFKTLNDAFPVDSLQLQFQSLLSPLTSMCAEAPSAVWFGSPPAGVAWRAAGARHARHEALQ